MGGHCFNQDLLVTTLGIYNAISDFAVLLLPIHAVCKLQMPLKKKIGIFAIFATGFLLVLQAPFLASYGYLGHLTNYVG